MADKIGCPYCGVELHSQSMGEHIKAKHYKEFNKKFRCKNKECAILHDASFGKGLYCSKKCSSAQPLKDLNITNISMKDISKINTFKDGKYCCPECESSYLNFSRLNEHVFKKHVKKTGVCENCGKEDSSYGIGRFCSNSCANSNKKTEESKVKTSLSLYTHYKNNTKSKSKIVKVKKIKKTLFINFEEELKKANNYLYKYPNFKYKGKKTKIKIVCFNKNHENFMFSYSHHLKGYGCPQCRLEKNRLINYNNHIEKCILKHGGKYTYEKFTFEKFINCKSLMKISCPNHGLFEQYGQHHLEGRGCKICAQEESRLSQEVVFSQFREMNGDKCSYENSIYIKGDENIKIFCNSCKESFYRTPDAHKKGSLCYKCYPQKGGFDKSKKGILYYIRIDINNEIYYKIGITNLSVKKRFSEYERQFMTVIKIEEFELGMDAYNKEQSILKKYKQFRYKGDNILESGNTELFIYDVLRLDI